MSALSASFSASPSAASASGAAAVALWRASATSRALPVGRAPALRAEPSEEEQRARRQLDAQSRLRLSAPARDAATAYAHHAYLDALALGARLSRTVRAV